MSVRMPKGVTDNFFVGVGLHQGSALSPFLFTSVMDVPTRGIQDELSGYMLFADTLFLLTRPDRELMTSWSDGGIH